MSLIKGKQIASQTITLNSNTGNVIVTGQVDTNGYPVVVTTAPTSDYQLTNKAYVDAVAQGVSPHAPVKVISSSELDLIGTETVDSVALIVGDYVLVNGQSDRKQNGIYTVQTGTWTRRPDADGSPSDEVSLGDFVFVSSGSTNAASGWVLGLTDATGSTIAPGVNTQLWYKMAAPGSYSTDGQGLELVGNIFQLELDGSTLSKSASGLKVSDSLSTVISSSAAGVTSLSSALSSEISATNSDVISLSTSLSTETSNRVVGDTSLSTAVSTETSTRTSADTSLSTLVSSETSTRTSADTSLSTAISSTSSSATSLSTAVSVETSNRTAGDTSLSTLVSAETSTRTSADTSLSTLISAETSTRTSADTSLSTAVSTEISTRSSAVTSLSTAISSINNPDFVEEMITPANSGTTSAVVVTTTSFGYGTGVVDEESVTAYLNGIQYPFDYTQGTPNVFHTNGVTPTGTNITLYFDATVAGFPIETSDFVTLRYMVVS